MAAAGEEVDGRLLNVERNRADLLDGVGDQPDIFFATQAAEGGEVEAVAVTPLYGADGDDARAPSDARGDVLDQDFAATIWD